MAVKKSVTPAKTASKISPARQVAFHLLRELAVSTQLHSDDLLQGTKVEALSPQDRNLCTALVMGVLRWQLALDQEVAKFLTHKTKLDEPVRIALRLGVFQLLFLDRVPVHSAISDSVELTKRAGHRFASGLVNAVLRKIVLHAGALRLSVRSEAAHPEWLLQRWRTSLGEAEAAAVCNYDQQQPRLTLRITPGEDEEKLRDQGIALEAGDFLTEARHVAIGTSLLRNEAIRIQDEGSQLVAELLGGSSGKMKSILDGCAAPGGKTAILAERHPSARVVAWDISAHRLAKMKERFRSMSALVRIECEVMDVTNAPVTSTYDLILCDVPCTGTGTLARNPEIKLRLQLNDLPRQQEHQIAILTAALRHLAPGGRLVYSTCSLEHEEGEDVVQRVLATVSGVRVIPVMERIGEMVEEKRLHQQGAKHLLEHAVRGSFLRTIPGISWCDGFFAALLTRD